MYYLTFQIPLTFRLWSIGCDAVENVDQHKEECYEQSHSSRDYVGWDYKTDPRYHHEQTWKL